MKTSTDISGTILEVPRSEPSATTAISIATSIAPPPDVSYQRAEKSVDPITTNALPGALADNWVKLQQLRLTDRMFGRLVSLANVERPGVRPLTSASLKGFLDFWSLVRRKAADPELALAPDGSLHAEWFKSVGSRLDVRFTVGKALFGLLASGNIQEGADTIPAAAQTLRNHPAKPLEWG
jgi:hypothetical protein